MFLIITNFEVKNIYLQFCWWKWKDLGDWGLKYKYSPNPVLLSGKRLPSDVAFFPPVEWLSSFPLRLAETFSFFHILVTTSPFHFSSSESIVAATMLLVPTASIRCLLQTLRNTINRKLSDLLCWNLPQWLQHMLFRSMLPPWGDFQPPMTDRGLVAWPEEGTVLFLSLEWNFVEKPNPILVSKILFVASTYLFAPPMTCLQSFSDWIITYVVSTFVNGFSRSKSLFSWSNSSLTVCKNWYNYGFAHLIFHIAISSQCFIEFVSRNSMSFHNLCNLLYNVSRDSILCLVLFVWTIIEQLNTISPLTVSCRKTLP